LINFKKGFQEKLYKTKSVAVEMQLALNKISVSAVAYSSRKFIVMPVLSWFILLWGLLWS